MGVRVRIPAYGQALQGRIPDHSPLSLQMSPFRTDLERKGRATPQKRRKGAISERRKESIPHPKDTKAAFLQQRRKTPVPDIEAKLSAMHHEVSKSRTNLPNTTRSLHQVSLLQARPNDINSRSIGKSPQKLTTRENSKSGRRKIDIAPRELELFEPLSLKTKRDMVVAASKSPPPTSHRGKRGTKFSHPRTSRQTDNLQRS